MRLYLGGTLRVCIRIRAARLLRICYVLLLQYNGPTQAKQLLHITVLYSCVLHVLILQRITQLRTVVVFAKRPAAMLLVVGFDERSELLLLMFSNAGKPWKSMTYEFNYREIFE